MTGRLLIDTNVLIYATLAADPRHRRATEILESRRRPGNALFVSTQNLAEMYPNLTGPKTQPPDSPVLARQKIAAIAALDGLTVLPVTRAVVERTLELCETHGITRQRYFDVQLIALMVLEQIPTLVTENAADFAFARGITVINPFA